MEVTETLSDGLKREFQVKVPAPDLEARVSQRLDEIKGQVQLRGFRPGKVPVAHLKKLYGRSVMAETIEAVIREINSKIVEERGLKLAMEPKITLPEEETEVEKVIGGESDLAYTVALEVLPKIELADFKGITLERLATEVADARSRRRWARSPSRTGRSRRRARAPRSRSGDRVVVDFTGKLEGQPFEGGTGGDIGVNVGSNTFIPGFEDQLIGMAAGEKRLVKVTFPTNYTNAELAGKAAEFDVTAKSVEAPGTVTVDDAFAKSLGMESLDKLKEAVKGRIQQEHAARSRQKLKRMLLDQLDAMHQFALPPTLAEEEFKNVWSAVENDLKRRTGPSRTRARPRRRRARNIGPLPSGGCASVSCLRKSARRTISR